MFTVFCIIIYGHWKRNCVQKDNLMITMVESLLTIVHGLEMLIKDTTTKY